MLLENKRYHTMNTQLGEQLLYPTIWLANQIGYIGEHKYVFQVAPLWHLAYFRAS